MSLEGQISRIPKELQFSRRYLLKSAGVLALGAALHLPPRVSADAPDSSEQTPQSPSTYISPTELQYDTAVLGFESETESDEPKTFQSSLSYMVKDMAEEWHHQPGLSIQQDPVDIFLGPFYHDTQTLVWNFVSPIDTTVTPEAFMQDIVQRVTHEQKLQNDTHNMPGDANRFDPPYPNLQKVCNEDGWLIETYMPNTADEGTPSYFQVNTGFFKDNKAWQFNLKVDARLESRKNEYFTNFQNMLNSIEISASH